MSRPLASRVRHRSRYRPVAGSRCRHFKAVESSAVSFEAMQPYSAARFWIAVATRTRFITSTRMDAPRRRRSWSTKVHSTPRRNDGPLCCLHSIPFGGQLGLCTDRYLNYGSLPSYIDKDYTEENVRQAHAEWETNSNWCGIGDASTVDFNYAGRTTRSVGVDGYNVVEYGESTVLGCSSASIACHNWWYSVGTGRVNESDIRLDDDVTWTNRPDLYPSRFDVWHVMAHEVGHRSLFGHTDPDTSQVMYSQMARGQSFNRWLSLGDATGNNAKW